MLKLYIADTGLITDKQVFDLFFSRMKKQRRTKVLRCKNEKDRLCSLLAGVLLRHGMEEEGLDYDALEFGITKDGKPILVSHPHIYFSLSHSGNRAVCLISDKQIGVDIEYKSRRLFAGGQEKPLFAVAKQSFTKKEYDVFRSLSGTDQQEYFLQIWTRKEAVSKAIGKGLAMDFSKIDEAEERFMSFWVDEEYFLSIYKEEKIGEELVICMMN